MCERPAARRGGLAGAGLGAGTLGPANLGPCGVEELVGGWSLEPDPSF